MRSGASRNPLHADGRILYTRKRTWPQGIWASVAGFVEQGETAEQAAIREVHEEAGLEAMELEFFGTRHFRGQLLLCFRVRLFEGQPMPGSDVDFVELAEPNPERIPSGAPARWLLEQHLTNLGGL